MAPRFNEYVLIEWRNGNENLKSSWRRGRYRIVYVMSCLAPFYNIPLICIISDFGPPSLEIRFKGSNENGLTLVKQVNSNPICFFWQVRKTWPTIYPFFGWVKYGSDQSLPPLSGVKFFRLVKKGSPFLIYVAVYFLCLLLMFFLPNKFIFCLDKMLQYGWMIN